MNWQSEYAFLNYFEEISGIPRESGNETRISDYLMAFGQNHGLTCHRDRHNNVILQKPASPGREGSAPVFLQAHTDMVCVKLKESTHDFSKDGIQLIIHGDIICGKDTSLGADNGLGMSMVLQVLADDFLSHPAITALFTVDEERGLAGVKELDLTPYPGNILINVDGEEEGVFYTSCAGGVRCTISLPLLRQPLSRCGLYKSLEIEIQGLSGGHSGLMIDKDRGNAVVLLGRLLHSCVRQEEKDSVFLSDAGGGAKENSIPQSAQAVLVCKEERFDEIHKQLLQTAAELKAEYKAGDPQLRITVKERSLSESDQWVLEGEFLSRLTGLLLLLPDGMFKKDIRFDTPAASSNVGVLRLLKDYAVISSMVRSNINSVKQQISSIFTELSARYGGTVEFVNDYTAWEYNPNSKLIFFIDELYKKKFGSKPCFTSIHGGLECAWFTSKRADMDMITMGCNINEVHSVNENFSISSASRTCQFLQYLLEEIDFPNETA